jgi:signal recognition particle 43 kDa protein
MAISSATSVSWTCVCSLTPLTRRALHFACGVGSEPCVRLLLSNRADVGAEVRLAVSPLSLPLCAHSSSGEQDKVGYTPLHIAAGYLNKSIVRILLEAGADPEAKDKQERSPLDLVLALKSGTPTSPEFFARRAALDDMAAVRVSMAQRPLTTHTCVCMS